MRHRLNTPKPYFSLFQHSLIEKDDARKMVRHFISSNQPNSYKQVLDSNLYDDDRYSKNPQVLYMHGDLGFFGQRSLSDDIKLTIAKSTKRFVETDGNVNYLGAETEFDKDSKESMDIYRLYVHGFMNAWSKYWYPIGKVEYDDEQKLYVAGKWGQYEYSAVKVGADGLAVGSDTYENALKLVETPMMKHALFSNALDNSISQDFTPAINKFDPAELTELKNKIEAINPGVSSEEVNKIIKSAFRNFLNELTPKLTELANSQKQVSDLMQKNKVDIEAIAEEKCVHVIKKFMGKEN